MTIGLFAGDEFRSAARRPKHTGNSVGAFLTDGPDVGINQQIFIESIGAVVASPRQKSELRNIRAWDGKPLSGGHQLFWSIGSYHVLHLGISGYMPSVRADALTAIVLCGSIPRIEMPKDIQQVRWRVTSCRISHYVGNVGIVGIMLRPQVLCSPAIEPKVHCRVDVVVHILHLGDVPAGRLSALLNAFANDGNGGIYTFSYNLYKKKQKKLYE